MTAENTTIGLLRLSALVVVAVGLLSTSAGCMHQPRIEIEDVPIPIVLGKRLHVGADPSFGRSEMLERILIEDVESQVGEQSDSAHNATVISAAIAEQDPRHAARNLQISGSAFAVWFILPGGGGAGLSGSGDVIGVLPAEESRRAQEP